MRPSADPAPAPDRHRRPLVLDTRFDCPGSFQQPAFCRLRLYEHAGRSVAVITEVHDNPGTSITNCIETVCHLAVREYELDLAGPNAALLLFDDGRLPSWNASEIQAGLAHVPRLRVVRVLAAAAANGHGWRDADGSGWRAWGASGDLAALLRPDGFVGWMATRPPLEAMRAGVEAALGRSSPPGALSIPASPTPTPPTVRTGDGDDESVGA